MDVENPPCFGLKPGIQNQKTSGMGMAPLGPLAEGELFNGIPRLDKHLPPLDPLPFILHTQTSLSPSHPGSAQGPTWVSLLYCSL